MTTILQITDTHIVPNGHLVSGRLASAEALARLVDRIAGIRDRIGPIDAVLVTGDISDDGSAESYARFLALVAPLDLPLLVIPGNHDRRTPMRAAFDKSLPADGPLNWSRQIGGVTVIGLDSLVEGQGHGMLAAQTLAFLSAALASADGVPVLVALHHPPFRSGIDFMDRIRLENSAAFADAIAGYAGELRIVCGHVHNLMVSDVAGHIAMSAPSPCSTFDFDRRPDAPVGFNAIDDGCLLHRHDGRFHSVRIGPAAGPGPFPF